MDIDKNEIANRVRHFTTAEADLVKLDDTFDEVEATRKLLLNKVTQAVGKVDFDSLGTDPKDVAAATSLISTAASLLRDVENNVKARVNAKLRKIDTDNGEDFSGLVQAFLKESTKYRGNNATVADIPKHDLDKASAELESAYLSEGGQIQDTELRTDYNDLS